MSSKPTKPARVVTADGYDVEVWESVEAVTAFLCDAGDAGHAWTEDGNPVTLTGGGRLPVTASVSDEVAAGELRRILERFLEHVAAKYDEPSMADRATSAPLQELVDRVAGWESPTRRHRKDSLRNRIAWYLLFRRR